jgi:ribosomal silencing factor RsfS
MEDPLIPMINVIVNAADARKATSISAFRISSITEITTFMVIVEGMLDSKMSLTLHISEREMIYLSIFSLHKPLNHLDLLFLAHVR